MPASSAMPPSPNSTPSWTPAVPPPPVAGAAVTVAFGVTVTVAVGVTVTVDNGFAVSVAVGVTVTVDVGVAVWVGGVVSPPLAVDVIVLVAVGDSVVGNPEGVDDGDVQPETAARPTRAAMPQPTAVSRERGAVPARALCTLIRYPSREPRTSTVALISTAAGVDGVARGMMSVATPAEGAAPLHDMEWRRIAGFRVVASWPQDGYAPPPTAPAIPRARAAGIAGALLLILGIFLVTFAIGAQQHAPQPSRAAAGSTGPEGRGPWLRRSMPVSVVIPAIGVNSKLLHLGVNANGTMQVPSLQTSANLAAWYKYSVAPGQIGTSIIEGHVDTYQGPAVFFRLGALSPGDTIDVTLADGITAIFRVTGVREFRKADFPANIVYGATHFAALHLITCGGTFDYATGHYLSSTVVFASLVSSHR
jgi:Sortase domain